MGFTRAAAAASSNRAKIELVRLLFCPKYNRRGPEAHRMLDHSIYTHAQLKTAYLERIQEIHPDKRRSETTVHGVVNATTITTISDDSAALNTDDEFISLQEAWSRYEEFARALTKVNNGSREADFTLFGVGCSFSDTEAERERRNEITDQACKGWFFAGELSTGDDATHKGNQGTKAQSSLLDDDMFMVQDDEIEMSLPPKSTSIGTTGKRKSLVDQMIPRRGKR